MLTVILKGMVYPYKYNDLGKLLCAENWTAVLNVPWGDHHWHLGKYQGQVALVVLLGTFHTV